MVIIWYLNASSFLVPPPATPEVQYKVTACIILMSLACKICCGLHKGVKVYPPLFTSSFSTLNGLPLILSIIKRSEAPGISSRKSLTPTKSLSSNLCKALKTKNNKKKKSECERFYFLLSFSNFTPKVK